MKRLIGAAALAAMLFAPALAHHAGERFQVGDLNVSHVYTFENAEMAHSVRVYLTIENTGAEEDRLIEASVDFAGRVLFEGQAVGADGTVSTAEMTAIAIAPGQTLTLQPGALWIELESVQRTFEHGEHFDMTLTFEKAGTVDVEVEIEEAPGAGDHHHDHQEEPAA